MGREIPIIDIKGDENATLKLKEACEKWGCFRVINHGVSEELMVGIKSTVTDLFDLPVEIKQRTTTVLPGSGYYAPPIEISHIKYEAFALDIPNSNSLSSFCYDLEVTSYQREIMEKYNEAIHKLGTEIVNKMAEITGKEDSVDVRTSHFRMNKYSITPDTISTGGLMTHTDCSLITILQDDDHFRGLEIVDPSGDLVAVDCFPGTFVVNIGDIAVPWSNGKLRPLAHRVLCKDVGVRMSLVTFITPTTDKENGIVAHPNFMKGDCAPKYRPFKYAEYRKARFSKMMLCGELLDTFALDQEASPIA